MRQSLVFASLLFCSWSCSPAMAQPPAARDGEFLAFIQAQAARIHEHDRTPPTLDAWREQRLQLRQKLEQAWGGFPREACPLDARKVGELTRDGYRVEKILLQTRPGVRMTANAYVPDKAGKHPAVLCVHGHWRGAKQDPVVQSRCIGLVRHGFFVLAVDAFGAGERGIGKALGEYHGEMTGATLFPVGLPLSGLQVYENLRAVDYLRSRPEVDGDRIGITGASGGGNQSMYAGAWDERLAAVVPVCSVGNYQAYLGVACCMCEVVPGAMGFTEEWGVLGLTAPRGLLVVNATRDGPQFSVAAAKKSLAQVEPIYQLFAHGNHVRHAVFESPHDYSRAMRETMYGWMKLHLAKEGDGSPLSELEIKTEDPEALRCFPGESRPDDFVTIPLFAAAESRRVLALRTTPADAPDASRQADKQRRILQDKTFGGVPSSSVTEVRVTPAADGASRVIELAPEPGLKLAARQEPATGKKLAILLDFAGAEQATKQPIAVELRRAGWSVVTLDLRATGALAYSKDKIGRAPDHNTAEWSLWIGRPLLGQWVVDVRRTLDAIGTSAALPGEVACVGVGPAGLVAVCAAALDSRIQRVAAIDMLSSFVTEVPYEGQRLGILVPGILRDVGDVSHLVSLVAPRRVVLAGSVSAGGKPLSLDETRVAFQAAQSIWKLLQAEPELRFADSGDARAVVADLGPPAP